jgi:low affinity Fe/Cu permease
MAGKVLAADIRSLGGQHEHMFARLSTLVADLTATPYAFCAALALVGGWLIAGIWFGYGSDLYHLLLNSPTTAITFLMVFILQNSQARTIAALHLKLDELLRANSGARDEMMDLEDRDAGEQKRVKRELTGKA